ncbi:MAG: transketolase [Candidatus Portnoybacteria bacterium]|nr:transketolase [Candidatus Portnoybacteria bacterium]
MKTKEIEKKANLIRQDIINMLAEAGSGHSAGSLGMADIFATIYFSGIVNHKLKDPDRDRIILSNAHICPAMYSALARSGYFPIQELLTLRKIDSRLQGHPHKGSLPGIESSGGPVAHNSSVAAGMAYVLKLENKPSKVYCLVGDGEQQEGQTWEIAMFAAKYKLNNLIFIMDRNTIQIEGETEEIMPIEPIRDKYRAFNWNVIEIDGHNIKDIIKAIKKAKKSKKPIMIIAKTIPGKGVSFIQGKHAWHGRAPTKEQAKKALKELRNE